MVVVGELCCLSEFIYSTFTHAYIVMIVLKFVGIGHASEEVVEPLLDAVSCGNLNRCQLDRITDSFPLTSRPLIKVYIVYYFACKLARAKNEMCFFC